jgi:ABC-type sugar transport system permease subunit/ABC-type glycerol-3-phosphate transport system substrate-binding protein
MRRFTSLIHLKPPRLALLLAPLALAWFLYPTAGPTSDPTDQAGIQEIRYWTPSGVGEALTDVLDEFERRNPQYRVVLGSATTKDVTSDPTRFLLGVAGGVPPDLIYFDRFAIVEWASRGAFEDLRPYLESQENDDQAIGKSRFFAPAWDESVYNEGVYGVPVSVDTRALYFHSDALVRADLIYEGIDEELESGKVKRGQPRPPQSWEELCRKLLDAEGRIDSKGKVRLVRHSGDPKINLQEMKITRGDVIVLITEGRVFRARIGKILSLDELTINLDFEQPPNVRQKLSGIVANLCHVKIFDKQCYVSRLTRYDPETGVLKSVGFLPLFGNSWLYLYGWLNGGSFMEDDGKICTLDAAPVIEALEYITDVYDAMGGMKEAARFMSSVTGGTLDPFLTGQVAIRIDSNGYLRNISNLAPHLHFGVAPAPIPQARRNDGFGSLGWTGGFAVAIPSTAKNKKGAFELMRWLCSVEANRLMLEHEASVDRSKGNTFLPRLHPDRQIMAWLQSTYIRQNASVSTNFKQAYDQFVDLLPTSKYRPVTPVGQKLWTEHNRATERAIHHVTLARLALSEGRRRVQEALDRHLQPPTGPVVVWTGLIILFGAGVFGFIGLLTVVRWWYVRGGSQRWRWLEGYACISPWLLGFIVFGMGPMLFSVVISFCRYDVLNTARFVGLANYGSLLGFHVDQSTGETIANDPLFWKSLANTAFMMLGVPLSIVAGLALALLLDTGVRGLTLLRAIFYLPAIVPAVALFILWIWIFNPTRGLMNDGLAMIGVTNPPDWLNDPGWAKPSLIIMGLWGVGGSMIIWLAGLKDIPKSLYEAAMMDGAGRWQRFGQVTLPLLSPYIFFNLIMGLIGTFQIFDAAYIMTAGGPIDSTLFYAYKLFNDAFRHLEMGKASAMAWILFVIVIVITIIQGWLSQKWVSYDR